MPFGIIYVAINKINEKRYVGLTTQSLEQRQHEHLTFPSRYGKTLFHKAIRKYGKENFEWRVLSECHSDQEELVEQECFWIHYYKSNAYSKDYVGIGYNMTDGGQGGRKPPESYEKAVRTRKANGQPWHSEETKRKNGLKHKGKTISPETREKLSLAGMGKKPSQTSIEKAMLPKSEVTKKKMSESSQIRWEKFFQTNPRSIDSIRRKERRIKRSLSRLILTCTTK